MSRNPWSKVRLNSTVLMMLAALALGAMALFGAREFINSQLAAEREKLKPKENNLVAVVVAKRDLIRGDPVDNDTMSIREIPRDYVSGTAIRPADFDRHRGAQLLGPLRSGEPLLLSSVYTPDATFSSRIRSGIRAMTVSVDEINSISGMLQPGDHIDLMLSTKPSHRAVSGAASEDITVPLMQDVLVLATGKQVRTASDSGTPRTFTTVTLEAEPQQAQRLVVAQRSGRLTAILRNPADRALISNAVMDLSTVLGAQRSRDATASPVTEVIVGGQGSMRRQSLETESPSMPAAGVAASVARGTLQARVPLAAPSSASLQDNDGDDMARLQTVPTMSDAPR